MLDVDRGTNDSHHSSLAEWVNRAIGLGGVVPQTRLWGNKLHIICESSPCPNAAIIVPKLLLALKTTVQAQGLPGSSRQPIYQIILYGRALRSPVLEWIETIDINEVDRLLLQWLPPGVSLAAVSETPLDVAQALPSARIASKTLLVSHQTNAPTGSKEAIAGRVSEALSFLASSVRIFIESLPAKERAGVREEEQDDKRRLWVAGNCDSCPTDSSLASSVATRLRDLKLEGFSDAVIRLQIKGTLSAWMLRVNLTPREEMLLCWARWGDEQALARLLDRTLAAEGMEVRAVLKDITLHLFCSFSRPSSPAPDRVTAISPIAPLLEYLAPAGIQAAVVYGVETSSGVELPHSSPVWIEWLNLPALMHPDLAVAPIALAQQGSGDALTFLLERLLNPDIDQRLATGGIEVAIRRKKDLLHIITSATACPQQSQVAQPIAELVQSLKMLEITGVRVYGRRAGQRSPVWRWGVDFVSGKRERAAAGGVRNFLPQSDSPILALIAGKLTVDSVRSLLYEGVGLIGAVTKSAARAFNQTRSYCSTHLFIPPTETLEQEVATGSSARTENYSTSGLAIASGSDVRVASGRESPLAACVWGAVGLLLTVQADWLLGQLLRSSSESSHSSVVVLQNNLPLQSSVTTDSELPAPVARASRFGNSSFNNALLDEKLALYKQACSTHGAPDVLIVGSSRALRGVDPQALQKALAAEGYADVKVFNFGINGATAQVVDLLIRRLLTLSELPKLIIWADGARAFNSGRVDVTYNAIRASEIAEGGGAAIDLNSDGVKLRSQAGITAPTANADATQKRGGSWTASYQAVDRELNQALAKVSSSYTQRDRLNRLLQQQYARLIPAVEPSLAVAANISLKYPQESDYFDGFLPVSIRFDRSTYYQHHARVSGDYDSDYESFHLGGEQGTALQALLEFVGLRQIPLVFVNLPLTDDYLEPVRQEYETQFQLYMEQLASQKQLIFLDLSQMWPTKYEFFSDPSHLNRYGAYAVSNYLAQDKIIPWLRSK